MQTKILRLISICLIISFTFSMSGCETLRKKFIREKKKKDENTVVPLLEPIDYPDKVITPTETYQKHYGLWQVWSKDLIVAVEENSNDKRILFLMQQTLSELKGMALCISSDKVAPLSSVISDLEKVNQELSEPSTIRNMNLIQNKIERAFKSVRENWKPKQVQSIFNTTL